MNQLGSTLNEIKHDKILDIGTGVGNFIMTIDEVVPDYQEIVGIDLSKRLLDRAATFFEANPRIRFLEMDASKMSFEDNVFDIVTFSNSLHHIKNHQEVFQEVERVLKPGGYFLVNEMLSDSLNEAQMSHLFIHHFAAEIDRIRGFIHDETFTKEEIIALIKKASHFKIVSSWEMQLEGQMNPFEGIDGMKKTVDQLLKQVENHNEYPRLYAEGERMKKYFDQYGVLAATQFLILLEKE
ncbi:MAG: class I SAM-dependent methyltransferase [Candidatus Izemoplasmatales bacterium]